jgi:hypothetical protein
MLEKITSITIFDKKQPSSGPLERMRIHIITQNYNLILFREGFKPTTHTPFAKA